MVAGIGWWYFRESPLPEYGPAYREYAYVTNGKSNTVTIINVLAFRAEKTLTVGSNPTGIASCAVTKRDTGTIKSTSAVDASNGSGSLAE